MFITIFKKAWVYAYIKFDRPNNSPAIDCFREIGEGLTPPEMVYSELRLQFREFKQFV